MFEQNVAMHIVLYDRLNSQVRLSLITYTKLYIYLQPLIYYIAQQSIGIRIAVERNAYLLF